MESIPSLSVSSLESPLADISNDYILLISVLVYLTVVFQEYYPHTRRLGRVNKVTDFGF